MNKYRKLCCLFLIIFLIRFNGFAQSTQTIRGTVVESLLQQPLSGATVTINGSSVSTDSSGSFRFDQIPVGTHTIRITHVHIKEIILPNLILNAGKELVLTIPAEIVIKEETAVVVKTDPRKNKPQNELSVVSARGFTVEETQRYAAAVNDPLRMATNFAGVVSADDGNNNIVIRGNSPAGLLWRMEGVDIPNPNHFSNAGGSGGGISILSTQLLANSDFLTGAFAAEYGNALSGVFDLKLRKGNNEKAEYALQAGMLGLNAAAEGPFKKNYKGSYLLNYRYSTLNLLNALKLIPEGSPTDFQDLSYHIYLPAGKAGNFSLFGFTGLNAQKDKFNEDSTAWKNEWDRTQFSFAGKTSVNAISHSIRPGKNSLLKTAISYSEEASKNEMLYAQTMQVKELWYKENYRTRKLNFTSTLHYRFNAKSNLRTGFFITRTGYKFNLHSKTERNEPLQELLNTSGNTTLLQAFAQWQYKVSPAFTFSSGLHFQELLLNKRRVLEPRASLKWELSKKQSLSFGYGLHSQTQALGVYFAQFTGAGGTTSLPNKNLDFTRSHHWVVSHQYKLGNNLRLRTELYYQLLRKVPVANTDTSTLSTVNIIADFITDPLVNKGRGRNYGLEVSLEKNLANRFYYMLSNSFYQAKYTAMDGIERNTRFNGGYVGNFVGGKEWVTTDQRRTFGINIKLVYQGGFRETPIDLDQSKAAGAARYIEAQAFTLQNPAYYRSDLKLSMKWNRRRLTSTLSLDLQNVTNRLNVFGKFYDPLKEEIITVYQNGVLPVLNYKIEF